MSFWKALFGGGGGGGLPDRDAALAHRLVEEEGALLLDVRSPAEFSSGHLPGAENIPVQQLRSALGEVNRMAGDKPIVVYCASGMRSGQAKRMLIKAGHEQVTNLGGIGNW